MQCYLYINILLHLYVHYNSCKLKLLFQNRSPPVILKAMVEGACQWILAGLPLTCLKLVLFAKNDQIKVKDEEAVKMFDSLKNRWSSETIEVYLFCTLY